MVKDAYEKGDLSEFAAQDLTRLFQVMDESKSAAELKTANRKRIKHFNETLDLKKRDKTLSKKDFESYERKKLDFYNWQRQPEKRENKELYKSFLAKNIEKPVDNMIGFKERTPAPMLKKWQKSLHINSAGLTTHCKIVIDKPPTAKEERKLIKDIERNMRENEKLKHS